MAAVLQVIHFDKCKTELDLDCYQVLDRFRQRGLNQPADYLHSLI